MKRKKLYTGALLTVVLLTAFVGGGYAIFTDSESTHVRFEAGTINISLSGEVYEKLYLKPEGFDDWKPGDYEEFELNIKNVGNNKAWIQLYIYETPPWTEGRPKFWDVAEWGVTDDTNWNKWVLSPQENMQLKLWVDFPQWVGNDYQGAQGDLLILVVAKQWRNKYGEYDCVALENKNTTTWLPELSDDIEGIVCIKPGSGTLDVDVNAYGLLAGGHYQLTLQGPSSCTSTDHALANNGSGPNYYVRGYYNGNPSLLEPTCGTPGQGIYNYAGAEVGNEVIADANGTISHTATINLPAGIYNGVTYVIKHDEGAPPVPTGPWTGVLMEMSSLSFTIP